MIHNLARNETFIESDIMNNMFAAGTINLAVSSTQLMMATTAFSQRVSLFESIIIF
jgi:hypothetical protein